MLPPPPIRGIFRTDQRARAAYAEGAGIFRILPAAVCVPAGPRGCRVARPLGGGAPRGAGAAGRGQRHGRRQRGRRRRRRPHRAACAGSQVDAGARRARASASVTLAELNRAAAPSRPPAPARSVERPLGHARRHALHQRRGRADGALRQRAPLGRERRARHGRWRGDRAPPRRGSCRPHARDRPVRGRGRARHPRWRRSWFARGSPGPGRTPRATRSTPGSTRATCSIS